MSKKKTTFLQVSKINWKTSVLGIISGLMVLLMAARSILDSDPDTNPDIATVSEAVTGIAMIVWGLITRDADKSSQDSGIR